MFFWAVTFSISVLEAKDIYSISQVPLRGNRFLNRFRVTFTVLVNALSKIRLRAVVGM